MGELQAATEMTPVWTTFMWCFYPIALLVVIELLSRDFDDDDDEGGGMMIPSYQGAQQWSKGFGPIR